MRLDIKLAIVKSGKPQWQIAQANGVPEIDRLARIWPAFGEVGWLATVSTSGAIRDKQMQDWLRPPEGLHVYLSVTGDVARWRELAKVRLWLAGYGYCKLASPNRHTGVCNIPSVAWWT
jgi:hypothetical protein